MPHSARLIARSAPHGSAPNWRTFRDSPIFRSRVNGFDNHSYQKHHVLVPRGTLFLLAVDLLLLTPLSSINIEDTLNRSIHSSTSVPVDNLWITFRNLLRNFPSPLLFRLRSLPRCPRILPMLPLPPAKPSAQPYPIQSIPISSIRIPDQPDRFRPGDRSIDELAASIHQFGLLQAIIVTPTPGSDTYELLAGHRRLLACISLGWPSIDAKVIDLPPGSGSSIRLTENIQREDLSPLEEAVSISRLRDALSLTQEQAAHHIGKGLSWIKKREALLRLPDDVMDALQFGQVNPSVALELGRIDDDHTRRFYLQSAVDYGATQDVASTWVQNYLREGATASPEDLADTSEKFRKASAAHKLPCFVCERTFPLNQLSNLFACPACYEAIAGAARHVPEKEAS